MNWALFIPCLITLFVSWVLSYVVREASKRWGALDRPSEHKQHRDPTPTMGGLAVFFSFLLGLLWRGWPSAPLQTVLLASFLIVLVGVIDDTRGVNAVIKLGVLGLATVVLIQGGILFRFGHGAPVDWTITFLWIGFVSSAFNGIDNSDGSAAGVASIAAGFAFLVAWSTWQRDLALIGVHLAAACLGFLAFNFPRPRATLFLGDTGSFFLGFCLSAMILLGQQGTSGLASPTVVLALIGFPVLDFCFILIVRGLNGHYRKWSDPITMCARDHVFHRLVARGLTPREAVLLIYAIGVLFGAAAVAMSASAEGTRLQEFSLIWAVVLGFAFWLARTQLTSDVYEHVHKLSPVPSAPTPIIEASPLAV